MATERDVLDALRTVRDPELNHSIVELGMIQDVEVEGGQVWVHVRPTTAACPFGKEIVKRIESVVRPHPRVASVDLEWGGPE
ncbi:MAG: iron-sulfur cluster assembly protein [Acidobacteriota bacterium]